MIAQIILQVWADALGVPTVGLTDNFFTLGGHSLKVITAIAAINRAFKVTVPLSLLFQNPTPLDFSRALKVFVAGASLPRMSTPERVARGVPQPLSSGQRRLWYVTKMDPNGRPYLLAVAIRLSGDLQVATLCAAFDSLQRRHGILRTVFSDKDGSPWQTVMPDPSLELEVRDAQPEQASSSGWIGTETARLVAQGLSLSGTVPVRAALLAESTHQYVLLLTIHHMLVDEWALGLLVQDLGRYYEAGVSGKVPSIDENALDFVDYAAAEQARGLANGFTHELAYWRQKLKGVPVTSLPAVRARPGVLAFKGGNHTASLSQELFSGIVRLARTRAVTPFVVLLTGFFALLHRYIARSDLCIGIMDAGRDDPALGSIVGPLARPLALRVEIGENETFESHFEVVQKTLIEAWLHRDAPFEQIVSSVSDASRTNANPLFQILIVMQNLRAAPTTFQSIKVEPLAVDTAIAEFDLMVEMFENGRGLTMRFSYNCNLYAAAEIELFAERLESLFLVVADEPSVPVSGIDLLPQDAVN